MFRHKGKTRTLKHNLRIASLLSVIAGIVNVTGFLSIRQLTTNVTGHFAFFIDEIFKLDFLQGFIYFLYIFFFFIGSFTSNFIIEALSRKKENLIYVVPTVIESFILLFTPLFSGYLISTNPHLLAFLLLFAMGLQNSLVTTISNASVRTTHLTGLFTDLGIELSQLYFYKQAEQKQKLHASIKLRLTIISFFFLGGILGGILYSMMALYGLAIAAIILLVGIASDYIKLKLLLQKRKYQQQKT